MSFEANVPITFECQKCGGKKLELPDDPTDDSIAKCTSCGAEFGRWGDIREAAANAVGEAAVKSMRKSLKEAFKDSGFKLE